MEKLVNIEDLKKKLDWIIDNPYVDVDREIMEDIDKVDPVNPAESVFNELCKRGLFTDRYDAKNGNRQFMNGIWTVMETIASLVSDDCRDRFNTEFAKNLYESELASRRRGF